MTEGSWHLKVEHLNKSKGTNQMPFKSQITGHFPLYNPLNQTNTHTKSMCHTHTHTIHYLTLSKHKLNLHTHTHTHTHTRPDTLKKNPFVLFEQEQQSRQGAGPDWVAWVCVGLHLGWLGLPLRPGSEEWSQAESLPSVRWMKSLSKLAVLPFWLYNTHNANKDCKKHTSRCVHRYTHTHTHTQTHTHTLSLK